MFDLLPWIGLLTVLLASVVLLAGWLLRRRAGRVPAGVVRNIRQEIARRPVPFTVCAECRVIIEAPCSVACPRCAQMGSCIPVRNENDRDLAAAAVGSS